MIFADLGRQGYIVKAFYFRFLKINFHFNVSSIFIASCHQPDSDRKITMGHSQNFNYWLNIDGHSQQYWTSILIQYWRKWT